jgi:hypothetical protein
VHKTLTILKNVILSFMLVTTVGMASLFAEDQQIGDSHSVVRGKILTVENEWYVVKDQSGKEVRLQVDRETAKSGNREDFRLKVGDTVEAYVSPDGHAQSLNVQGGRGSSANEGYR